MAARQLRSRVMAYSVNAQGLPAMTPCPFAIQPPASGSEKATSYKDMRLGQIRGSDSYRPLFPTISKPITPVHTDQRPLPVADQRTASQP